MCGAFDVRALFAADESDVYYDATTGNPVAIWSRFMGSSGSCVAGPPDFVPPSCAMGALSRAPCPDGGADAADASAD
jgi:hypothetical protein